MQRRKYFIDPQKASKGPAHVFRSQQNLRILTGFQALTARFAMVVYFSVNMRPPDIIGQKFYAKLASVRFLQHRDESPSGRCWQQNPERAARL